MDANGRYILDENDNPVLEPDLVKWGQWFETADDRRQIGRDLIGAILISTVFLGLDHRFGAPGAPLLFETMIFDCPKYEGYQERCSTCAEALSEHAKAVALVKAELN